MPILKFILIILMFYCLQDILSQASCDAPDISADSKASISQDVMKFLMYQTYQETSSLCSSPGFDDKKFPIGQ